jgi:hypothetical protein
MSYRTSLHYFDIVCCVFASYLSAYIKIYNGSRNRMIPNLIPKLCSALVCTTNKVLRYGVRRLGFRSFSSTLVSSFAYSGCKPRCTRENTKVKLASLAYTSIWPRNTGDRKIEHESHDCCDW